MSLEPPRTFLAWVRSQKLPPSRNLSRLSSRLTQCLRVGTAGLSVHGSQSVVRQQKTLPKCVYVVMSVTSPSLGVFPALTCYVTPGGYLSRSGCPHFPVKTAAGQRSPYSVCDGVEKPGLGQGRGAPQGKSGFLPTGTCAHLQNPTWTLEPCTQMLLYGYLHPTMGRLFMPHTDTHVTCTPTHADTYRYKGALPPRAVVPVEPQDNHLGLSSCSSLSAEGKPGLSPPQGVHPGCRSDQTALGLYCMVSEWTRRGRRCGAGLVPPDITSIL